MRVDLDRVEQGEPTALPVLLLPGLSDSWRSFTPVLAELPADVHALAVSQRGHGLSSRPASGYRPEDYAADVIDLLDALAVDRAVLAGHSSSTLTARLVAAHHPQRVAGLVLVASPLTLLGHPAVAELASSADFATGRAPVAEDVVRRFVAGTVGPSVSADFLEAMVGEALTVPGRVWHETFRGLLEHDAVQPLGRIQAPALLVWGDADPIIGRADQDALGAGLPASRLLVYTRVGHSPHWEQPRRFATDVTAFVRELGD